MKKRLALSLLLAGSLHLVAYPFEIEGMAGKNYSDNDSILEDAPGLGIRLNTFISESNAIQIGYDHINNVKYKVAPQPDPKDSRCTTCIPECPPCPPEPECTPSQENCHDQHEGDQTQNGTGTIDENGNENGEEETGNGENQNQQGEESENGEQTGGTTGDQGTETGQNPPPSDNVANHFTEKTDIERYYINGLHEIHNGTKLIPFVFAGFGYEHVNNERAGYDSGGFFNAGGGLKYRVNKRVALVSEAKAIKKFDNGDLDISAMLGLGLYFGGKKAPARESAVVKRLSKTKIKPVLPPAPVVTVVKVPKMDEKERAVAALPHRSAYYIQVAAAFKTHLKRDCKHYLHQITDAGLPYRIKKATVNGKPAELLLVGPYRTPKEAKTDLPTLRKIDKGAFIKKIID
ncbi:MAG: hypothetical protein B6D59_00435 [Campylobacteraceae bacterium 4484_4]|nr:MAG: hypothetical protein B6D59_00435 [Campylobacteraceae bacterium 4484_4]